MTEKVEDHPAWLRLKIMHANGDFDKIERVLELQDTLETFGKAGRMIQNCIIMLGKALLWCGAILAVTLSILGEWPKLISKLTGGGL